MSKLKKIQATPHQDTNSLRNAHVAADLCYPATCIDPDMRNNEVYAIFERDPSEQILPVIENQQIVGLINRERFMGTMAGRFHWEVYSKKRCKKLMEHDPVVIDAQCSIVDVAERLLGGGEKHVLADCFIIARSGVLLGIRHGGSMFACSTAPDSAPSAASSTKLKNSVLPCIAISMAIRVGAQKTKSSPRLISRSMGGCSKL